MVKDLAYEFMRWREQIGKEGGLLGWAGLDVQSTKSWATRQRLANPSILENGVPRVPR